MDCGACGASNREGAKFCTACGAAQPGACIACGNELRPNARFCDECGVPAGESGVGDAVAESGAANAAVRKTVTVLFCDLVGSTAFGEAVDAESVREAMSRYHEMAREAVAAHGGTVTKFIGDGVMVVFGVPEISEDDADRAVAAGIELQRRFGPIGDHVQRRYGAVVGLRVGINTGEVVIADDDADIVGDALNTAARLEAACTPGPVIVGEDTWRLTRSTVKYDVLGEVAVKGKAQPVATFQVVDESGPADEAASPFVGRDGELGELRRVLDEAVEERTAKLVSVIGAPGVGKTRLASELVREQSGETRTFYLRCERSGTTTFAPVTDLLRSVASIGATYDAAQTLAALDDLIGAGVGDRDRLIGLLGGFVGATTARSTEEAFFAVRRLLELLGADRPVLIVVDDIQWAELLFLDLLEHLVEWVKDAPVLIVTLARPEIRDRRRPRSWQHNCSVRRACPRTWQPGYRLRPKGIPCSYGSWSACWSTMA